MSKSSQETLDRLTQDDLMRMRIVAIQCAAAQQQLYHGDVVKAAERYYEFMFHGPREVAQGEVQHHPV